MNHKHSGISSPEMFVHQRQVRDFPEGYALNASLCVLYKNVALIVVIWKTKKNGRIIFSDIPITHFAHIHTHSTTVEAEISTQAFYQA